MNSEETTAAGQEPQPMTTIAVLDAAGVYQGLREIAASDVGATDVYLPDGCDLQPGAYAWDVTRKTFVAVGPVASAGVPTPDALNAIALGLFAVSDAVKLPSATLEWMRAQFQSFDFAGAMPDPAQRAKLSEFVRGAK